MKPQWLVATPLLVFATLASAAESTSTIVSIWETLISRPVTLMTLIIVTASVVTTLIKPNLALTAAALYLQGIAKIIEALLEDKPWAEASTVSGIIISMGITAIIEILVVVIAIRLYRLYRARKEARRQLS